jgi:D-lactate dehydrogenase
MKLVVFSAQPHDRQFLSAAFDDRGHSLVYIEAGLTSETAIAAHGADAVCCFVNDDLGSDSLKALHENGIRHILLRCAGFNNVDLPVAGQLGMTILRVPEYSPAAVAEHTLALILCLNRGIHRAWSRVREGDFRLAGLLGFDLSGKTVGIIGTGRIGQRVCRILKGFGCHVIACDQHPDEQLKSEGVEYVDQPTLLGESRIISLHCPLTLETRHLINRHSLAKTRKGVLLINTSRGALVDTQALVHGLKSGHVGGVALDVYEEETGLFFADHSMSVIKDDVFARLLTFPNVLITGHQGFFTEEALTNIAATTLKNMESIVLGQPDPACVVRA